MIISFSFLIKMVLYSADISQIAVPVKSVSKKTQKRKLETIDQEIDRALKEVNENVKVPKKSRQTKKVKQEAQLKEEVKEEVKEKKKRVRKPKIVEIKDEVKDEPKENIQEPKVKIKIQKPKVKKLDQIPTPELKPVLPDPTIIPTEPPKEPPKKKKRVFRDPTLPPIWFSKFMEGVKKEELIQKEQKVSMKSLKTEAQEAAKKSWDDGLTRDRVNNEIDNHMSRMYSMIFSRR